MLVAKSLHKVYNNGNKALHVLKGIDINIQRGKVVSIVGPSGAGKSTCLHLLGGLDQPSEGEVLIDNIDLYKLSDCELSRVRNERFGFVFQFYHLLPEFTVLENVILPVMVKSNYSTEGLDGLKNAAIQILKRVGLGKRAHYFPSQLSGGERQRVAICRGLVNNPEMLFCDEPTGNLDAESGKEITALIKDLNSQNNMAVVLVTHNQELAKIADNIFYLKDGVLVS